jgi:transcriptional regulator
VYNGGVYLPAAFRIAPAEAVDLIGRAAAGHVVTTQADGSFASSFIPLQFDANRNVLVGHLARANDHHLAIGPSGVPALVLFTGTDSYVTPSWYATKASTGKVVPTWNYELVQVHGNARIIDDPALVAETVRALTDQHEHGRTAPWSVDDAPTDYLESLYKTIVRIEIAVDRIEGKRKLSQNRPGEDILGVLQGLRAQNDQHAYEQHAYEQTRQANVHLVTARYDNPAVAELIARYVSLMVERLAAQGRNVTGIDAAGTAATVSPEDFDSGAFLVVRVGSETSGRIVGCAGFRTHQRDGQLIAEIKRMYVGDEARGLGIARMLLGGLLDRAWEAGAAMIELDTSGVLTEAIQLYRSAGFVEVDRFNDNPFADHWFRLYRAHDPKSV